ncbi:uncharacterized protein LOC128814097 [Vidua macroura]|uniref:uncharacterized protein LOC128814097 n=1 Tax=Vidua macroura TaxID=187451 RepID=UPI0023A87477|nr:uncharacterized protein LOC128814097 [Vidua macroura]
MPRFGISFFPGCCSSPPGWLQEETAVPVLSLRLSFPGDLSSGQRRRSWAAGRLLQRAVPGVGGIHVRADFHPKENIYGKNLEKKHQCRTGCAEENSASEHHLPWQKSPEEGFEFRGCAQAFKAVSLLDQRELQQGRGARQGCSLHLQLQNPTEEENLLSAAFWVPGPAPGAGLRGGKDELANPWSGGRAQCLPVQAKITIKPPHQKIWDNSIGYMYKFYLSLALDH